MISDNLNQIRKKISTLEQQYRRQAGSVQLLAVSKRKPLEDIQQAIAAGQIAFGENYADEGAAKIAALSDDSIQWHFIGHVQSNKTRLIASHYNWVQSVERAKIIERLSLHRPAGMPPLNICLQVNIEQEQTKSGCLPGQLMELAELASTQPNIKLRGIMAIPAPQADLESQRAVFAKLAALYQPLQERFSTVDTLSIGMSADMDAAIAEGATMVRIGTAIFGERDQPPAVSG